MITVFPRRAFRRAVCLCLALAGCAESVATQPPPKGRLYFPVGVAVHPAGWALVVNSNFDMRYKHGSLQFVDLRRLQERVSDGEGLGRDHLDLVLSEPEIALPSFGASVKVFGDEQRGLAAVACRQSSQVLLIDMELDAQGLSASCGPEKIEDGYLVCQGSRNIVDLDLGDPFGLVLEETAAAASWQERRWSLWVSFLGSGELWQLELPPGRPNAGDPPQVVSRMMTGAESINDLVRSPATGYFYATSRYNNYYSNPLYFFYPGDDRVQSLELYGQMLGNQTRGLAFLEDGYTLAVAVRDPDVLAFLDTSIGLTGYPRNRILALADLDNLPAKVFSAAGLILVSDAEDDSVSIIDARTRRLIERRENICRGPFDFARWRGQQVDWVLISCFEEDLLAVLDVDPASATFTQVVARIGQPKAEER